MAEPPRSPPAFRAPHDHAAGHEHSRHDQAGHGHPDHDHTGHSHAGHGHAGHVHAPPDNMRAFAIGTALNIAMVVAELTFGFLSNSLALIADGAHNFSDVIGLVLAWAGAWLARRAPSGRRTYGYRRASILAALANAALLFVATGGILIEALRRLSDPEPVAGPTVMIVAFIGIVINTATALLFMRGRKEDLNVHGAFLHMAADAAVSVGVVIAAGLIMVTGWQWIDPAIGIVIAVVIFISTWQLAKDSVNLALDAVPAGLDRAEVEAYLAGLPGVSDVHDLHIWALSTTEIALTAHLVRPNGGLDDAFLSRVQDELAARFRIGHAALQIEAGDPAYPCRLAPAEVI